MLSYWLLRPLQVSAINCWDGDVVAYILAVHQTSGAEVPGSNLASPTMILGRYNTVKSQGRGGNIHQSWGQTNIQKNKLLRPLQGPVISCYWDYSKPLLLAVENSPRLCYWLLRILQGFAIGCWDLSKALLLAVEISPRLYYWLLRILQGSAIGFWEFSKGLLLADETSPRLCYWLLRIPQGSAIGCWEFSKALLLAVETTQSPCYWSVLMRNFLALFFCFFIGKKAIME